MSNWRFVIVVVVLDGKPPLMGEVLCSTENSPFLIIDHIHAKINRVCCAALAIGKRCMNVRKNKLFNSETTKINYQFLNNTSNDVGNNTDLFFLISTIQLLHRNIRI